MGFCIFILFWAFIIGTIMLRKRFGEEYGARPLPASMHSIFSFTDFIIFVSSFLYAIGYIIALPGHHSADDIKEIVICLILFVISGAAGFFYLKWHIKKLKEIGETYNQKSVWKIYAMELLYGAATINYTIFCILYFVFLSDVFRGSII